MAQKRAPHAIFVYGTLRADWGPNGDRWGVLNDRKSPDNYCVWQYATIQGFSLKQSRGLDYPFIHRSGDGGGGSTHLGERTSVFGTLVEWPNTAVSSSSGSSEHDLFAVKLAECDLIEGFDAGNPDGGLYLRSEVEAQPAFPGTEPVLAYVYHQAPPEPDAKVLLFPEGDWLGDRGGHGAAALAAAEAKANLASHNEWTVITEGAPTEMVEGAPKTKVFSYGSNGISQLRARVENPTLEAMPAVLPDYVLAFCLRSPGWGGGSVATLSPLKGERAYGSVVELTNYELYLLDMFEGGYEKQQIQIVVGNGTIRKKCAATAYLAMSPYSVPEGFMPPSEQYRTAIDVHLRENWGKGSSYSPLGIRRVDYKTGAATAPIELWANPGPAKLTLEALCVEINVLKEEPWVMPRTIQEVVTKLNAVGITTVPMLAAALQEGDGGNGHSLNAKLAATRQLPFGASTSDIMVQLLL